MDMKTCYYCGGSLEEGTTTLNKYTHGEHFIIEDVPARMCCQCGEKYFDSRVIEKIDEMLKVKEPVDRVIPVPVLKYKVA